MGKKHKNTENWGRNTKLTHLGRDPDAYHGLVNPPIARTSTILYPDLAAYENRDHRYRYGRLGNPISDSFEAAMTEIEGGYDAITTQTGLSAITTSILAFVKTGDHILMVDTVYPNAHDICRNFLDRMGVEVEYYDPTIGAGVEGLIRENTALIYLESPGSGTFEVQDMPAMAKAAKKRGVVTIADNTWSAGLLFNPIAHGIDVSLQSCTKYIGGHSDVNLGVIVAASEEIFKPLRNMAWDLGVSASAEDLYLALRGLRSVATRLKQAQSNAQDVIDWLLGRDEVSRVFYPALETHPTHDIWKRDFTGANGLFSVLFKATEKEDVHNFVNALELFPIGSSWGGYESLCQPQYPKPNRQAVPWAEEGTLLRFQVGLEDPNDLIADFEQAFQHIQKT